MICRKFALLKSEKRLAAEKTALESMHSLCGGKLITMALSLDDLAGAGIPGQNSPDLTNIYSKSKTFVILINPSQ